MSGSLSQQLQDNFSQPTDGSNVRAYLFQHSTTLLLETLLKDHNVLLAKSCTHPELILLEFHREERFVFRATPFGFSHTKRIGRCVGNHNNQVQVRLLEIVSSYIFKKALGQWAAEQGFEEPLSVWLVPGKHTPFFTLRLRWALHEKLPERSVQLFPDVPAQPEPEERRGRKRWRSSTEPYPVKESATEQVDSSGSESGLVRLDADMILEMDDPLHFA